MSATVLIVIAMRRDYFAGAKTPLPDMEHALERAARLIALLRANAMPVIHVRHLEHVPAWDSCSRARPVPTSIRVAPQGEDG